MGAEGGAAGRVALVHDWLTGMRGGERVLERLCALYPEAALFTLVHVPGSVSPAIERRGPRTSFIQRLPRAGRWYRYYLPLFPAAVERLDLRGFDLVISSSHCAVKGVVPAPAARHVCYCHSPMRYAWDQFDSYFGPARVGRLRSRCYRLVMTRLARWDAATAGRVHRFVANSQHVAGRIARYYNRVATVVHPPVDTAFFTPDGTRPERYFLVVSALVPYKRVELAVEACGLLGAPLKVVGEGPELPRLRRLAGPDVAFLGRRPDEEVRQLYRGAAAVLQTGEEDFGIVPVEAQACGRPVVALARGGALETVADGAGGVLVSEPSAAAFAEGLDRVRRVRVDPAALREQALRFSPDRFDAGLRQAVAEVADAPAGAPAW